MREKMEEKKVKAVKKVLGEPVAPELQNNAWNIRTNLIIAAVIVIAIVLADLRIDPESTVLGLKFSGGFSDNVLRTGLLLIVVYLSIHFLWTAVDSFLEWRLRITGTRLSFITTGRLSSEHGDYPNDPRQSTLYYWWISQAERIGNFSPKLEELKKQLQSLESDLRDKYNSGADAMNIVNACRSLHEGIENIAALRRSIEEAQKTLSATRIPVSLERFNKWFEFFLRSQNLRWLIIDIFVPLFLSVYAILLLWKS